MSRWEPVGLIAQVDDTMSLWGFMKVFSGAMIFLYSFLFFPVLIRKVKTAEMRMIC